MIAAEKRRDLEDELEVKKYGEAEGCLECYAGGSV